MIGNIVAGLQDPGLVAVGDFESIATVTVGSGGVGYVEFTSIPSTYQHLQLRILARASANDADLMYRFNSDTGSNYSLHRVNGNGAATGSEGYANSSKPWAGVIAPSAAGANIFGVSVMDVLDYADSNKYTTTRSLTGYDNNGSGLINLTSGNWRNTTAVNAIRFIMNNGGNIAEYSHFALYGIKG